MKIGETKNFKKTIREEFLGELGENIKRWGIKKNE